MAQGIDAHGYTNAEVADVPASRTDTPNLDRLTATELVEHQQYLQEERDRAMNRFRDLGERQGQVVAYLTEARDRASSISGIASEKSEGARSPF